MTPVFARLLGVVTIGMVLTGLMTTSWRPIVQWGFSLTILVGLMGLLTRR